MVGGVVVLPAGSGEPQAPKSMSDEEGERLRRETSELVEQLAQVSGSKELELLDNIAAVGSEEQRKAAFAVLRCQQA